MFYGRSAAVPAAVRRASTPAAPRARRPRDSRQDAGATIRRPAVNHAVTVLVLTTRQLAAQYRDGGFGESKRGSSVCRQRSGQRRIVRIGMAVGSIVDPNILFTAESHERDWPLHA